MQRLTFEFETLNKEINDAWAASNCLGSTWGSQAMDEERMSYNLERELMSLQIVRRSEEHSFKNAKREADDAIERAQADIVTAQRECEGIRTEREHLEAHALASLSEKQEQLFGELGPLEARREALEQKRIELAYNVERIKDIMQ